MDSSLPSCKHCGLTKSKSEYTKRSVECHLCKQCFNIKYGPSQKLRDLKKQNTELTEINRKLTRQLSSVVDALMQSQSENKMLKERILNGDDELWPSDENEAKRRKV
jgi:septal ring factor EnvC (AmiA/AmiB activator)